MLFDVIGGRRICFLEWHCIIPFSIAFFGDEMYDMEHAIYFVATPFHYGRVYSIAAHELQRLP